MSVDRKPAKVERELYGKILHAAIKNSGIAIEQIEKDTGISKRVIYNIIQGKGYTMDTFLVITKHLNLSFQLYQTPPPTE